jgi:hypothetical protein
MKLFLFCFLFCFSLLAQPSVFIEQTNINGQRWHVKGVNVPTNQLWAIRAYTDFTTDPAGFTLPNQSFEFGNPDAIVAPTPKMFFNMRFIRQKSNGFVFVDAIRGNDGLALRNSFAYPSQTLTNAIALSGDGDDIYISTGDYYVGPSLYVSNRNLVGRDSTLTRILGGPNGSSIILNLAGSTYIGDVTVESTNKTGQHVFNLHTTTLAPKDITLNRIKVLGDSDGITIGGGTTYVNFVAFDCEFYTHYDAVICSSFNTNSLYKLYNCTVVTTRDPTLFGGTLRSVAVANSKVYLVGCSLSSYDGIDNTLGVYSRTGELYLISTKIKASSQSGLAKSLVLDGGKCVIRDGNVDTSQIQNNGGTVVYE